MHVKKSEVKRSVVVVVSQQRVEVTEDVEYIQKVWDPWRAGCNER